MAKETILWTLLPYGRSPAEGPGEGRWRLSVVVSPRLTPQAAGEQTLASFPEWLDWPATLAGARFATWIGSDLVKLVPLSEPDSDVWKRLFGEETPVAGFVFKDMSKVNLRSYAVRQVLGFMRRHYGRLAADAGHDRPSLLPWRNADASLKNMLVDLGTRTQKFQLGDRTVELPLPGFDRFFGDEMDRTLDRSVFGPNGVYTMGVPAIGAEEQGRPEPAEQRTRRVMATDWYNPRPGGPGAPLLNLPDAAVMDQFASADEYAFYQADRFYRRERPSEEELRMRRPSYADLPAAVKAPDYDFHRIVASFGDYPQLLRKLGLVLDFALEHDGAIDGRIAAGNGEAIGQVRLEIDWSNDHPTDRDVRPRTAFQADKERFVARPRGKDQKRGLLDLANANDRWNDEKRALFDVYQVDPDGAALKTVDFTLTAQRLVGKSLDISQRFGKVTYTTGDKQGVAALRSGGLGVSRHGRAAALAEDAAAGALKNAAIENGQGDAVTFFAEDLHRGYRIDVAAVPDAVSRAPWRSLCARVGDYRLINGGALPLPDDEGYVSEGGMTSSLGPNTNPDDHYLHESLFRWTGWSLCTPRPGLTIKAESEPDTQLQREVPSKVDDIAERGNGLVATFRVAKGSLPKLRFGQLYRMRARIVDVAGNSLDLDDPTLGPLEGATDAVGYWRLEPVDPPALSQRKKTSEGEQLERMVIRSNYDMTAEAYAAALPPAVDFEYWATDQRHMVPPKSSQQQCETHGLFDSFTGSWDRIKAGYEVAAREEKTLYDGGTLVTPAALAQIATTDSIPPQLPDATNPVGDRLAGGQYVIHPEPALKTAWLPDGAAGGVAIRAVSGSQLPGVSAPVDLGESCVVRQTPHGELVLLVRHGGKWPDLDGFRLILEERAADITGLPCQEAFTDDGAPKWDEAERTLTLFVPKGRIVRLTYASFVAPQFLESFGIPHWTEANAQALDVLRSARVGANWLITPSRDLTLVHATQAPVCEPELIYLSIQREPGGHDARLSCRRVRLHGPSTGKFEIEADWEEWVDDPAQPEPVRRNFKGQLGEIPLAENHANEFILAQAVDDARVESPDPRPVERAPGDVHALGDTRFRLVRYRVRATTRFREYLQPAIYAQRDKVTRLGPIAEGPAMAMPPDDDKGAPVLSAAAGSTAQSLVPASAPPKDPRLLYVVPTVAWDRAGDESLWQSTRDGDGLRVWLDRPWFSSGDGEMLGVVLFGNGTAFNEVPPEYQQFVTQWGVDPFWDSPRPKTRARATDFPLRVMDAQHLLQEKPDGELVTVVAHRVQWSDERKLWYADIVVSPGATYMPFIRLALVRYQPNALADAHLSKVVLAEFAQLLPRRRATFQRNGETIAVGLHGPSADFGTMKFPVDSEYQNISYIHGAHETGRNRVELVLQTRDPDMDTELGWEDSEVLLSQIVRGPLIEGDFVDPLGAFQPAISAPRERTGGSAASRRRLSRVERQVDLQAAAIERIGLGDIIGVDTFPQIDPPFWEGTATLGAAEGRPRRLMLREFERYYTDQGVSDPNRRGSLRRVIEERLVYAETFAI